jgi:hypothetical protein
MPETDTVHPMTGRWARAVTLLLGVATATVACSGSDGPTPASPLESAEPITAPPTTDAGPASTGAPEVTEPPTTTSSTTTTTTTTEPAPTTTTLDDLRAEIEADLNEGEQAFLEAGGQPDSAESRELIARFETGPALASTLALFDGLAADGHVLAPNPSLPSSISVSSLEIVEEGKATVILCRIDAGIVREASTGGQVGRLINDTIVRYTTRTQLVLDGGAWKISDGETLTREEGQTSCEG